MTMSFIAQATVTKNTVQSAYSAIMMKKKRKLIVIIGFVFIVDRFVVVLFVEKKSKSDEYEV